MATTNVSFVPAPATFWENIDTTSQLIWSLVIGLFLSQAVLAPFFPASHFVKPLHQPHRLVGCVYLMLWPASLILYLTDYDSFLKSCLVWLLPATGFLQACIASRTFTFLPTKQNHQGYYSAKMPMSYNFVFENVYFSGLLFFQWLYMSPYFYTHFFRGTWVGSLVEHLIVFLPYTLIRPFFPKTSFRDSLHNADKDKKANDPRTMQFFYYGTVVTKIFYVFAKHFIGFGLNYLRYLDLLAPSTVYHIYLMLIFSAFATTISMFLHTLKFKGHIGPRTSFSVYVLSYMSTFYSWHGVATTTATTTLSALHLPVLLGVLAGVGVNFLSKKWQDVLSVGLCLCGVAWRSGAFL